MHKILDVRGFQLRTDHTPVSRAVKSSETRQTIHGISNHIPMKGLTHVPHVARLSNSSVILPSTIELTQERNRTTVTHVGRNLVVKPQSIYIFELIRGRNRTSVPHAAIHTSHVLDY